MSRKFLILIITFVFALIYSDRSESKDVTRISNEMIEHITPDELHEESPIRSDSGIARENPYSASMRNLQPVQKKTGGSSVQKIIFKSGRILCPQMISRQYGYVSYYYPSTYTPDRMIIQLCKLII